MIAIDNANLVGESDIQPDGVLLIENDRIVAMGDKSAITIPPDAAVFDAEGAYVGPGFVDIHVHGGGGHFLYQEPLEAAGYFLAHGTTTVLAACYTDLDTAGILAAISCVKEAMAHDGIGHAIGGLYMEGPYLNPRYGAQPEKNQWKGSLCPAQYEAFVKAAGDLAKVWVVAPEREGLIPFLCKAREINPHVVISVGHSEATPDEVMALKPYGLCLQTHCTNATGRHATEKGTRSCGPDEACFLDDEMYAEVICDSQGIHVHPDMLRLILKIKGVDRILLISDSFVSTEPNPPSLSHITDLCFDANGSLCGSKLSLDIACRNMMVHTGCSMVEVFRMASRNPARVIGLDDEIGTLAVGKKANLVLVDGEFHVKAVFLEGKLLSNEYITEE